MGADDHRSIISLPSLFVLRTLSYRCCKYWRSRRTLSALIAWLDAMKLDSIVDEETHEPKLQCRNQAIWRTHRVPNQRIYLPPVERSVLYEGGSHRHCCLVDQLQQHDSPKRSDTGCPNGPNLHVPSFVFLGLFVISHCKPASPALHWRYFDIPEMITACLDFRWGLSFQLHLPWRP